MTEIHRANVEQKTDSGPATPGSARRNTETPGQDEVARNPDAPSATGTAAPLRFPARSSPRSPSIR